MQESAGHGAAIGGGLLDGPSRLPCGTRRGLVQPGTHEDIEGKARADGLPIEGGGLGGVHKGCELSAYGNRLTVVARGPKAKIYKSNDSAREALRELGYAGKIIVEG